MIDLSSLDLAYWASCQSPRCSTHQWQKILAFSVHGDLDT
jgi:hypothetical protein